ncbi:hypothetical protein K437DRAFT_132258 [Tilletiaria anomala UBC 951]|uniref:Uncharacterized protein n=1 Tax=Tilletiaria anomala (strain ATCC 24038 / CBS 436.72 / UBC 951) TaxID=1037660 RepID=A0A066WG34_TILAU|nr:uncharacterized protein K437DRAFT_132258 [Tilletiaria anomala UBC 951]KDN52917.1 hypothetical protein K437DRAFT_132258 [Tilletiaria anomala UBC 951]
MVSPDYASSNLSAETLVSPTKFNKSASLARSDPAAGLAMIQSMYGMGSSLAFPVPKGMSKASKSDKENQGKLPRYSPSSSSVSSSSSTSTKSDEKSISLSAEDFMRMYGVSGMQMEGSNVNSLTGSARKFTTTKRPTASADSVSKKQQAAKLSQEQLQYRYGFNSGFAFVVPKFNTDESNEGAEQSPKPKASSRGFSSLFGLRKT